MTSWSTCAPKNLMREISWRAAHDALRVHLPRGVQRHQAGGLHLRGGVGDPVLDRLLVAPAREPWASRYVARSQSMSKARCATPEPAHAVVDAARVQPLLGDQEAGALGAEAVGGRDPHALVEDLRVAAAACRRTRCGCSIVGTSRRIVHARRVGGHEEHRRPLVGARVGVGDRHDDEEVGDRGVGGEPLAAGEDVVVAVADGARSSAASGPTPRCRARSSRRPTSGRLRAAGAASAPSAPSVPASARISLLPESGAWLPNALRREGRGAEDLVHAARA